MKGIWLCIQACVTRRVLNSLFPCLCGQFCHLLAFQASAQSISIHTHRGRVVDVYGWGFLLLYRTPRITKEGLLKQKGMEERKMKEETEKGRTEFKRGKENWKQNKKAPWVMAKWSRESCPCVLKPSYRWVSWNSKRTDGAFVLILPITLKHADAWCSILGCTEGSQDLGRAGWSSSSVQLRCAENQGTYLTDLFQGGDEEVVTHNGQCVEHVHGLEERRRKGIKFRAGAEPQVEGLASLCFNNILC